MNCFPALLPVLFVASGAFAAIGLAPGGLSEFQVELPTELRVLAGQGQPSRAMHALVTIAVPANFDTGRDWPVMVVSATSDAQYSSSRRLLRAYADAAIADGWVLVATDPEESVSTEQDTFALRYALNTAALAALALQWPRAGKAPLAFGGFSGGAKYSGWLAAAFASQGRTVIGIYLAGINQDTVVAAARQFKVLDETFRGTPIFLQSGDKDAIATPSDHWIVQDQLKRAGFRRIRVEYFRGSHVVDAGPLRTALHWFRELAVQTDQGR